jgi:hypothetical protein
VGNGTPPNQKKTPVVPPRVPLYALLVPVLPAVLDHQTRFSFYFGISGWSKQWESADAPHRKRLEVSTTPIDSGHKIATLQSCIATTVAAYGNAVTALNAIGAGAIKVIHQGIGHGHLVDERGGTTADFGAQLGGFSEHEFRVATRTFDTYRALKKAGNFSARIGNPDPSPKDRARQLLAFDGLVGIRNAIKGRVSRLRIVTCNIGGDADFMQSLAWVLGRCRSGESPSNNVVLEAYDRKLYAGQKTAADRFKIGVIENPKEPDVVFYEANAETELPSQHLVSMDPSTIRAPDPNDPLNFGSTQLPAAMELGDCASLASLIPAAVLKT